MAARLPSLLLGGTMRGIGCMSSSSTKVPDAGRGGGSSPLSLRKMTTSDVPEVARIETTAFSVPWSEQTFRSLMHRSGVELWVAEWGDQRAA